MSRSGYTDEDGTQWQMIIWRGQVASAVRGKRGQAFLRELVAALDALPEPRLIKDELKAGNEVCALGSVGVKRGVDLDALDPEDCDTLANTFNIAHQLVREIEYLNDEAHYYATPEQRWQKMRDWAVSRIRKES